MLGRSTPAEPLPAGTAPAQGRRGPAGPGHPGPSAIRSRRVPPASHHLTEVGTMNEPVAPLVSLDANGHAEVIAYDIPQPAAYSGRNYIDLQLRLAGVADWFRHDHPASPVQSAKPEARRGAAPVAPAAKTDDLILARIVGAAGVLRIVQANDGTLSFASNLPMSEKLKALLPEDVLNLPKRKKVVLRQSMYGTLTYSVIDTTPAAAPLIPLTASATSPASYAPDSISPLDAPPARP